jgi:hypothetical protein
LQDIANDQYDSGIIDSPDPAKVVIHDSPMGDHLDTVHNGGSSCGFSIPHHIESGVDHINHYKDVYVESGYWDTQQVWVESGVWL